MYEGQRSCGGVVAGVWVGRVWGELVVVGWGWRGVSVAVPAKSDTPATAVSVWRCMVGVQIQMAPRPLATGLVPFTRLRKPSCSHQRCTPGRSVRATQTVARVPDACTEVWDGRAEGVPVGRYRSADRVLPTGTGPRGGQRVGHRGHSSRTRDIQSSQWSARTVCGDRLCRLRVALDWLVGAANFDTVDATGPFFEYSVCARPARETLVIVIPWICSALLTTVLMICIGTAQRPRHGQWLSRMHARHMVC
jgi:hypothetical protein